MIFWQVAVLATAFLPLMHKPAWPVAARHGVVGGTCAGGHNGRRRGGHFVSRSHGDASTAGHFAGPVGGFRGGHLRARLGVALVEC